MNEIKEYTIKMFEDIKHIDEIGMNIGSNTSRKIIDYKLSRYACYLIVLKCDPRKKVIALAKTYDIMNINMEVMKCLEYLKSIQN